MPSSLSPYHLWQVGELAWEWRGKSWCRQESWPGSGEVLRAGEQALALTSCSTQESGPCTSPGQHSGADPSGMGVSELAPRYESRRTGPTLLLSETLGKLVNVIDNSPRW